jgi:hypothetical protein
VPTVEEFTDPFVDAYTPPPPHGVGVCAICHGAPAGDYTRCLSCHSTVRSVTRPLTLVVPVSLYRVGQQLHTVLRDYKRSRDPATRKRHALQVAATLHRFVRQHGDCVRAAARGVDWTVVTTVPSKEPRHAPHPLETAISLAQPLAGQFDRLLEPLEPERIRRGQGSDRGFKTRGDVTGLGCS